MNILCFLKNSVFRELQNLSELEYNTPYIVEMEVTFMYHL